MDATLNKVSLDIRSGEYDLQFMMNTTEAEQGLIEVHWSFSKANLSCIETMILEKSIDGVSYYGIALYSSPQKQLMEASSELINNVYTEPNTLDLSSTFYRMRMHLKDKMIITTPPCFIYKLIST